MELDYYTEEVLAALHKEWSEDGSQIIARDDDNEVSIICDRDGTPQEVVPFTPAQIEDKVQRLSEQQQDEIMGQVASGLEAIIDRAQQRQVDAKAYLALTNNQIDADRVEIMKRLMRREIRANQDIIRIVRMVGGFFDSADTGIEE